LALYLFSIKYVRLGSLYLISNDNTGTERARIKEKKGVVASSGVAPPFGEGYEASFSWVCVSPPEKEKYRGVVR